MGTIKRHEVGEAPGTMLGAAVVWWVLCCCSSLAAAQATTRSDPAMPPAAAAATVGAPKVAAEHSPRSRGLRPPEVTVTGKAHARAAELTNEAEAHYDAGRYDEAAEVYRQAYAVVPAPELLFNLGQCQRLMGRAQRAVQYFEAYLRLKPNAPHRPLVEQLIEESKLLGPPAPALDPPRAEPPIMSSAPAVQEPARPVHDVNVMPLPPPQPLREVPRRTRFLADDDDRRADHETPAVYERWWFWTALAVVATGAAVTTYAVMASQTEQEPAPMTTLGTIAWD